VQTDRARRDLTELVVARQDQPVVQVKISPEVSGEIIEPPVKGAGGKRRPVAPDQTGFYKASCRSAEASFKSSESGKILAEANRRKAEIEFKRNDDLFRSKLVSESVFLEFKTDLDVAQATFQSATQSVEVARAALARAEEELAKTTISSPIDGMVSKLNYASGERVVGTAMMTGTEVMHFRQLQRDGGARGHRRD
jgi:HlyD family secretion protein